MQCLSEKIAQKLNQSRPVRFVAARVSLALPTRRTQCARELWPAEELVELIKLSVEGTTRTQLHLKFQRSTSKIFSKIQKHTKMLQGLARSLQAGKLQSACQDRESFDSLLKYIRTYRSLAEVLKEEDHLAQLRSVVPQFLTASLPQDLDLILKRILSRGLT